jgi:hypothetical protein
LTSWFYDARKDLDGQYPFDSTDNESHHQHLGKSYIMTDTGATASKACAHHVGENKVREEVFDLSIGIDMLIAQLGVVVTDIMNEEDAFDAWRNAHWIALRLKEDVKRIDSKILAEANATYERREAAPEGQLQ